MHVHDIEAALVERRFPQIETAFLRLVQWPGSDSVQGAEDADQLGRLLDRVTAALEADRREMPEDLALSILARAGDGLWLRDDRSYAAGARTVAARAAEWRRMFATRMAAPVVAPNAAGPLATS